MTPKLWDMNPTILWDITWLFHPYRWLMMVTVIMGLIMGLLVGGDWNPAFMNVQKQLGIS